MRGVGVVCLFGFILISGVQSQGGWSQDEMEIFDLVEEVEKNFYDFMGLSKDASSAEIRKAYRRLSLQLHPDKNPSPDASVQFRFLAGIYEVLKDANKREIYDRVLIDGLPSWRNPIFYYRRVRKMGLAEGLTYLFIIVTICQYLIHWAAYWERSFTLREVLSAQNKRKRSKVKTDIPSEHEEAILGPKPSFWDTLPFQLFRGGKYIIWNLPYLPKYIYDIYSEKRRIQAEEEELRAREEEALRRKEEEKKERKEQKAKRKRVYREEAPDEAPERKAKEAEKVFNQPANALQVWTDDDLAKLAKLMKKFPGGVRDRWERIAEIMERLPWEVTKMAHKVKGMGYCVPISSSTQSNALKNEKVVSDACLEGNYEDSEEELDSSEEEEEESDDDEEYGVYKLETRDTSQVVEEVKSKTKTRGGKMGIVESSGDGLSDEKGSSPPESDNWSQQQQKALESALQSFPKGISDRWDRISAKVPGKSKQQCMLRFKTIAEVLKKRKEASS